VRIAADEDQAGIAAPAGIPDGEFAFAIHFLDMFQSNEMFLPPLITADQRARFGVDEIAWNGGGRCADGNTGENRSFQATPGNTSIGQEPDRGSH